VLLKTHAGAARLSMVGVAGGLRRTECRNCVNWSDAHIIGAMIRKSDSALPPATGGLRHYLMPTYRARPGKLDAIAVVAG